MRVYDLIQKKKNGEVLTPAELEFLVRGYTDGTIPDYQMSAFAMAVYFQSMTPAETAALTDAMARSGDGDEPFAAGAHVIAMPAHIAGDKIVILTMVKNNRDAAFCQHFRRGGLLHIKAAEDPRAPFDEEIAELGQTHFGDDDLDDVLCAGITAIGQYANDIGG